MTAATNHLYRCLFELSRTLFGGIEIFLADTSNQASECSEDLQLVFFLHRDSLSERVSWLRCKSETTAINLLTGSASRFGNTRNWVWVLRSATQQCATHTSSSG